jgi:hypothetical protein
VSVNGTLVEDKMRRIKGKCAHFSFSKCHIYTDDGASANFSTNSHETDYSAVVDGSDGGSKEARNLIDCVAVTPVVDAGSADPCLPCIVSIGISVFCVHLVIYQQLQQLGLQKLAAEQVNSS